MGIQEIGSKILPTAYFSKINVFSTDSLHHIKVTLSLKDMMMTNDKGYWYDTLIQEYGKINLLCIVTDNSTAQNNISRQSHIDDINEGRQSATAVDSGFKIFKKTFPLSQLSPSTMSHVDRQGNVVHDFYCDFDEIGIRKFDLKDVYLYSTVYLDTNEIDYDNFDFSFIDEYIGYTKSEKVFKSGVIQAMTSYFIDNNTGLIWPGPVNLGSDDIYTAIDSSGGIITLERISIPNTKVNSLSAEDQVPVSNNGNLQTPDFLSEPEYSFSLDEDVACTFALDIKNLFLNNVYEAKVLYDANPSAFEDYIKYIDLSMVEIQRDPVEPIEALNKLFSPVDPKNVKYDDNDRIVVRTNNSMGEPLKPMSRFVLQNYETQEAINVDYNSLPQDVKSSGLLNLENLSKNNLEDAKKTGAIEEIVNAGVNVRLISFTDYSIKNLKGGEYKYSLKMVFVNKLSEIINSKLLNLMTAISELEKYAISAQYANNYDFANNQFKNNFIDRINAFYNLNEGMTNSSMDSPWMKAVNAYRAVYSLLNNKPFDVVVLMNNLAPQTATQQTIETTIKLMKESLNNSLKSFNYSETALYSQASGKRIGVGSSSPSKKTFTVERGLNKTITTGMIDGSGYSYFDIKHNSVPVITKAAYQERANAEMNKYFNSMPSVNQLDDEQMGNEEKKDLSNIQENKYSYFTPMEIRAGLETKKFGLGRNSFDIGFANRLKIARATKFDSPQASQGKFRNKSRKNMFRKASELSGFQFNKPQKFRPPKDKKVSSRVDEYVGTDSNFNNLETTGLETTSDMSRFDEDQNINILSSIHGDRRRPSGRVPSMKNFKQLPNNKKRIRNLPLQIKSLIMGNSVASRNNFDEYDIFLDPMAREAAEINYTKIRMVEYLSGYEQVNNLNLLANPIWKLMDEEAFNSIGNNRVICRVTPYINDYYDLADDQVDFKDYNTIFIISGE